MSHLPCRMRITLHSTVSHTMSYRASCHAVSSPVSSPVVSPDTLPSSLPSPLPARVGRLLLTYGDHRAGAASQLLVLPKGVGGHLCRLLCAAGYVTSAPHLGIFAGAASDPDVVISTRVPPAQRPH